MGISRYALGIGTAGLLAVSFIAPASAAPVLTNTAAVKSISHVQATDVQPTQVRFRRGAGVAVGVGAGLLAGAAIASQPNYNYYGGYGYYEPQYAYPGGGPYNYTEEGNPWYQGRVDTFKNGLDY